MRPILFWLGPFPIRGYGLMIALGGAVSTWFWLRKREKMGFKKEDHVWLLVNLIIVGGFLGGRVLHLLEYTVWFSDDFWRQAFSFGEGFSVMGAFLGVAAAVLIAARAAGAPAPTVFDYVCQAAPLWHAFGRFGCFLAGCCHGRPTDSVFGVRFTHPDALVPRELLGVPIHPTQLYEAGGDLAIAAALWLALRRVEAGRLAHGSVAALYFMLYGALRFALEPVRADALPTAFGLTVAQGFALSFILAGAAFWAWGRRCSRT